MPTLELILIFAATLILLSITLSQAASRLGVPALLLFLAIGMLAGSDGPGQIAFDYPAITQAVGIVALIFILFSGGFDTDVATVLPILRTGLSLATLGVLVTAVAVGLFAYTVLGFTLETGLLLGAVIASTDAAAVFGVLRARSVRLKGRLKPLLEFESGSNDPMAVFLTLGMLTLIAQPGRSVLDLLPMFVAQMGLGLVGGLVIGQGLIWILRRLRLQYDGLYPVLTFSGVLLAYSATALVGGSGFVAVYLVGILLGRADFVHKASLNRFHDGIAWLMQIAMFVILGLQVFPSQLIAVAPQGILTAAFLILVARPLSVFAATLLSPFSIRERLYISWVGLRGAAPIILATFPLLAGVATPVPMFNLVFFVVLASTLLQGTTLVPLARRMGLYDDTPERPSLLARMLAGGPLRANLVEIAVHPESAAVGRRLIDLALPPGSLITLLRRRDEVIVPGGSTEFEAGDDLLAVTAEPETLHVIFGPPNP
ncbi:MAG: potassium/proton antiporter [Chloroflexi bacterium]|nr:potassium/proton antiporter [Chloroflexota bacterium]